MNKKECFSIKLSVLLSDKPLSSFDSLRYLMIRYSKKFGWRTPDWLLIFLEYWRHFLSSFMNCFMCGFIKVRLYLSLATYVTCSETSYTIDG